MGCGEDQLQYSSKYPYVQARKHAVMEKCSGLHKCKHYASKKTS